MLTRRDTVRLLGAAGLAAPVLAACGSASGSSRASGPTGMRLVGADIARSDGVTGAVPGVVTAMSDFCSDLWGRLGPANANLALSPYSIAVALAMTANGAAGETKAQMLDVLHIDALGTYNGGIAALTQQIEALAGPVKRDDGTSAEIALATADQLFGDGGTDWGPAFLTVLAKSYGAGMRTVDFRRASEVARGLINTWTAGQTHGRIPTILPPGAVDATTRLVLVNALYLKAPWAEPFEKSATTSRTFTTARGTPVQAEMMRATPRGATYVQGEDYRGARLPYAGGGLAMTVALPDAGREQEALTALLAGGLTAAGAPGVDLSMPRFTFRTPTDLVRPLIELGMSLAFGDGADFSPMSPTDPLYIDGVLHQAFIAVDESGTEAAAATAVVMDESSAMVPGKELVLDRPFLFVVHDSAHGTPLFVGRVADPT